MEWEKEEERMRGGMCVCVEEKEEDEKINKQENIYNQNKNKIINTTYIQDKKSKYITQKVEKPF